MGEFELRKQIVEYLNEEGIYCWPDRQTWGGWKGASNKANGVADILGIIAPQGTFLSIECKSEKKTQSMEQKRFQKQIENAGGIYFVAYSLNDVKVNLSKYLGGYDGFPKAS